MGYPCAYGEPTCGSFKTETGSRWHSSCSAGRAVSFANRLLKEEGISVRHFIAPAHLSDQAEKLGAERETPAQRAEFERLNAAATLASALSTRIGLSDSADLGIGLAKALGVEVVDAPARTAEPLARFVALDLREINRSSRPDGRIDELVEEFGLANSPQEAIWVIAYDAMMQVRTVVELARGDFHTVGLSLPALVMAVTGVAADRFQIAHNHPSGDVRPSKADVALTQTVMNVANATGLLFEDHLIVGPGGDVWSFVDHEMLVPAVIDGHEPAPIPNR